MTQALESKILNLTTKSSDYQLKIVTFSIFNTLVLAVKIK